MEAQVQVASLKGSIRLGSYLRRLRAGYGYSLRRVEERARAEGGEIDYSQLSRYEKGVCYPSFDKLRVLAAVFNVSIQAFSDVVDLEHYDTLKLRMDLEAVRDGKLLDRADVPGVRSTHLYLLYRGVYDSLYDIAPGGNLHHIRGQRAGTIADLGGDTRDALKFENTLREAYVDIDLSAAPLSFRLGRQQVVWGETDNFRMLDRANPLDMTWHQMYESWDDLRVPLWMVKALWRLDQVGPLSDAFIETYWTPGDWYPAKQSFLPQRPWGVSQVNPLIGLVGAGSPFGFTSLYRGTRLFRQGDYSRDPGDNSQVGVRISAMAPQGIQFSVNYFYQRFAGDDGTKGKHIITTNIEHNAVIRSLRA